MSAFKVKTNKLLVGIRKVRARAGEKERDMPLCFRYQYSEGSEEKTLPATVKSNHRPQQAWNHMIRGQEVHPGRVPNHTLFILGAE